MIQQEKALFCALLAQNPRRERLLRYLSPPLAEEMREWPLPGHIDFSKQLAPNAWLDSMHFSWFCEPIKKLPSETRPLFLSMLGSKKGKEVCEVLSIPFKSFLPSRFLRPFLLDELKRLVLQGVEMMNEDYLPPSEMKVLLLLKRSQLLNLIDLLGIHDLSVDMRQIVDKELLQKIYKCLSEDQVRFLQHCIKQSIKWLPPKMGLLTWDGTKRSLQHMVHARGLARLGKGIYDEEEGLKWHLLHRLDTGRALVIEKIFRQKQEYALIPYFKNQVLHILKRYEVF